MDILDKINGYESDFRLVESGLRNMKSLAKQFKTAKIFFHKDLDGVTSALAIKKYLENNRIKVIDAEPIQYGGEEYAVKKTKPGVMNVLVDFAHGKTMMHIHTDHHDHQVGVEKGTSSSFVNTPSNVQYISQQISPSDIFSSKDIEVISTVDSADFSRYGLKPDDIMRATFEYDKSLDVTKNHQMMGLVCNKLILSYKNKKEFLSRVVMTSKPSLLSMFNVTIALAKKEGYKAPEDIDAGGDIYKQQRMDKMVDGKPSDIPNMKNGESFVIGNTVFQKGGGYMGGKNVYDRYAIFDVYPSAHYLITQWPMGMIQVAANPFQKMGNKNHLGDLVIKKVLTKFRSKLDNEMITLDRMKFEFERDIMKKKIQGAVGFNWSDFEALYADKLNGVSSSDKEYWVNMVHDISNKPYGKLSTKQKDILKKITVSAWDVIMASSGGHKSITNISGLNFLSDTKGMMNDISMEIAKLMKDMSLG